MRTQLNPKIEAGRVVSLVHGPSPRGAMYGAFVVLGPCGRKLAVVAGTGYDDVPWEHVSVSCDGKHPPNWQEMCWIKDQWWNEEETVVQFHPKRSQYVNLHERTLHLWKRIGQEIELPPLVAV